MKQAVLFDLWGTLFTNKLRPTPLVEFSQKIGYSLEDYSYVKVLEDKLMLEKTEEIEYLVKNLLEALSIEQDSNLLDELVHILKRGVTGLMPFPETINVLKELGKKYKLGMISNTDYFTYKILEDKYNIEQYFKVALKSFEIQLIKPDKKIFQLALDKLDVSKEEVVMVGDSLKDDVEAAEEIGIRGILIDRKNKYPNYKNRITSLTELRELIE